MVEEWEKFLKHSLVEIKPFGSEDVCLTIQTLILIKIVKQNVTRNSKLLIIDSKR